MTQHESRDPDARHDDPDVPDVPEEIDAALELVYGAGEEPDAFPSVLERIGERTGSDVRLTLRDADGADATPLLRPLGSGEPRRSGKYLIHGELGRGGVGAVHRGHDQELGRDVALKFLQEKYKDDPEVLRRFVEEAQIGGQLQHPGIVPVYDLGLVKGRPFFAMRLVKGETLAKRLARRESSASERRAFLSIFEDVCQTMAYAHARGVVHRDLKPANVMIGAFGEVQVVDWGVGKVLRQGGVADERLSAEPAAVTGISTVRSRDVGSASVVGSVMGTPAYMPPEQARGEVEAMDERSDVFALGAILCELLTGLPPYVGRRDALLALAASASLEGAHERLAACGAEPELVDLATRCLMPSPADRPRSAEVVARAVHEHLVAAEARAHDARVEAAEARVRAEGLERARTLAVGLATAVAAGLVVSLWMWRRAEAAAQQAERNEARAERELERAVEIKGLITEMLRSVTAEEAQLADTTLLRGILDDAAGRLERGVIEDELVAAELHHVVGDTYRMLALYDEAEHHLPRALEVRERLLGATDDDTLQARAALAHLRYAQGRFDEAEAGFTAVLDLHGCEEGRACPIALLALQLLASTVQTSGRFDDAERLYLEVLEIQAEVFGDDSLEVQESSSLGLGMLYVQAGRLADAERVLQDGVESAERAFGGQHPHTVRTKRCLASLRREQGRYDEALPLFVECVDLSERLWGEEHAETLNAKQELAVVHFLRGDLERGESALLDALAAHERALGEEHPATLALAANLAVLHLEGGRFEEAERGFARVLAVQRRALGEQSPDTLRTQANLATAQLQRGRLPEADRNCGEALAEQERVLGPEHPDALYTKWLAATIHTARARHVEAEALLVEVLEAQRRVLGPDHPQTLTAMETLASGWQRDGRLEDAEELFVEALGGWRRLVGEEHPQALFVQGQLALLRMSQGRDEAERDALAAVAGLERALGLEAPNTLITQANLGAAYSAAGRHAEAIATLEPQVPAMQRVFGAADERVADAAERLATSYLAAGTPSDAAPALLDGVARALLAQELVEPRDAERALALAQHACALHEEVGDGGSLWRCLDTLALAQHRTGDTRAAVETQRRALARVPEGADPGVAARLAEYEAAGD